MWRLLIVSVFVLGVPAQTHAAITLVDTNNIIEEATVVSMSATSSGEVLDATVIEGPYKGSEAAFVNTGPALHVGDTFYLSRVVNVDQSISYSVYDYYRLPLIYILAAVFVFLALSVGGIQGLRGLVSLTASLFCIFFLFLPAIFSGYSPLGVALIVAPLIIVGGSYVTHGFSRTTTAAVLGMLTTVLLTGAGVYLLTNAAHISGGYADGNGFVPGYGGGTPDLAQLLFASILIGLLGVLYDIAIGQAVVVEELVAAGLTVRHHLYARALRVGREHIGALVNTLAIAYVGFSLPLFLSLYIPLQTFGVAFVANSNQIATELIRILMSGIGLILAVPITTFIAVRLLHREG